MKILLQEGGAVVPQRLESDWFGAPVVPAPEFSFELGEHELVFRAARRAPAMIHPEARPGAFCAELWRYDTAEFFMGQVNGGRYLEFNLCPNGAWWAQAFDAPREAAVAVPPPQGVQASGQCGPEGWECRASLPLAELERLGLDPRDCRLAFAAILNTPQQIFLTTAEDLSGEPDFHRPASWPLAAVASR